MREQYPEQTDQPSSSVEQVRKKLCQTQQKIQFLREKLDFVEGTRKRAILGELAYLTFEQEYLMIDLGTASEEYAATRFAIEEYNEVSQSPRTQKSPLQRTSLREVVAI